MPAKTIRGVAREYQVNIPAWYPDETAAEVVRVLEELGAIPARAFVPGGKHGAAQWGAGSYRIQTESAGPLEIGLIPPNGTLIVGPPGWPKAMWGKWVREPGTLMKEDFEKRKAAVAEAETIAREAGQRRVVR